MSTTTETTKEPVPAEGAVTTTTTTTTEEGGGVTKENDVEATQDAAVEETAAPAAGGGGGGRGGGGRGGRGGGGRGGGRGGRQAARHNKEDDVPIEELFDLTKPIPKVDKPNKEEHEKEVNELSEVIKTLQDSRRELQEKIDKAMDDPASKSLLTEKRAALNALKKNKNQLIEEKKALRTQMDRIKTDNDKLIKDKKDARSNARFGSVEEIDKEIARLQKLQETTSMSLTEEKKLIKEVDALKASKKFVADLKSKDAALDDMRVQRKTLTEQITAKDAEIDALTPQMDAIMAEIKQINDQDQAKRDSLQEMFAQREAVRKDIGEKLAEKDKLRDAFRTANNAWFQYQRALKAQKKLQYEEEKAKREAERAEYIAKLEAEEAKKIPYEEEQALCDFLANYLERTYLEPAKDEDDAADKKEETAAVADNPFAGFTPINKKADDAYFGKPGGGKKKKRVRTAKKQDLATERAFTLSVDMFEQFGLLQLDPPVKLEDVSSSVQALREKKTWYQQQPRGSVPTAQEIRKRNELKARQQKDGGGASATTTTTATTTATTTDDLGDAGKKPKSKGASSSSKFQLNAQDFVPLGAKAAAAAATAKENGDHATTSTATTTTSWGPNATKEAAAAAAAAAAAVEEATLEIPVAAPAETTEGEVTTS
ncbi:hypothetical protein ACA910_002358 [Epithemia clementina (nom. ined.)]